MTTLRSRTLLWTPRVLAIAYIIFRSLFALDVFNEVHGFWRILPALSIHLIPSFLLLGALVLAWRWEWIGAMLYAAAGVVYIVRVMPRPLSPAIKLNWVLAIAGPALLVAALFLASWWKHDELHPKHA